MRAVIALAAGALFGAGACLSGMTRPSKVLGFLDFGGAWDATLLVVMAVALAIHVVAWRLVPAERHPGPPSTVIDVRLVGGAVLFGIGWGLGGYCPGPAVVSIVSGARGSLVFVAAMIAGMWLAGHAPSGKPDTAEG